MNPTRPLYGRITVNGKRTDLGFAPINIMFVRAAQVYQSTPAKGSEISLTVELSAVRLPDSSILNREAVVEQSLAAQIVTDPNEESPFDGISMGRVQEAMASPEYALWYQYCQPDNRIGVDPNDIQNALDAYNVRFPDCVVHFPKWIDS